jgi:hypothetical protein
MEMFKVLLNDATAFNYVFATSYGEAWDEANRIFPGQVYTVYPN